MYPFYTTPTKKKHNYYLKMQHYSEYKIDLSVMRWLLAHEKTRLLAYKTQEHATFVNTYFFAILFLEVIFHYP